MIVIKSSQNFFNRIYAIESHILLNISSSISVNGGIYHECRKKDIRNPLTIVSYLLIKAARRADMLFKLKAPYKPTGDQPQAIAELVKGFKEGNQCQTLLGVTGSGKTFTMANVIQQLQKPTLVIAHNKTLAAQLYGEFKEMFPDNAVEYFVSYYDYYQPEAYVPSSDTYIAKDSAINDEIDKLRLSATMALMERRDVIIVASVSCIYGLGNPVDYQNMVVSLRPGMIKDRDKVMAKLIEIQYDRNDMDFHRGTFRVRGDVLEIIPAYESDTAIRVEFFGDEIDRISEIDILTGEVKDELKHIAIFPASHYVVDRENIKRAVADIEEELEERVKEFKRNDKLLEQDSVLRSERILILRCFGKLDFVQVLKIIRDIYRD